MFGNIDIPLPFFESHHHTRSATHSKEKNISALDQAWINALV